MPYPTQFLTVLGSKLAYVEAGSGDPILFLHGNPTSKYLWRNIMPYLEKQGHVVALDLIGMGESDKPENLSYRFKDHYSFVEAFIHEKFGRTGKKITLVIHDWGSALGFHFAAQNPDRVQGIAFMEAIAKPVKWADFPSDFKMGFTMMRSPGIGWFLVQVLNMFVNVILPKAIVRKLTPEEKAVYGAPFKTIASRKPTLVWPREIPIDGHPADNHATVSAYHQWLQETKIPKLLLVADPGGLIHKEDADWMETHFPNLTRVDIGKGLHFIQEDCPHEIGESLSQWYTTNVKK
ncbi:MAG: hypothetical protein SGILL_003211 [Bacillariaceae sp.]